MRTYLSTFINYFPLTDSDFCNSVALHSLKDVEIYRLAVQWKTYVHV